MPGSSPARVAFQSCAFKLYRPSRRSSALLTRALRRYHAAYGKALARLLPELPDEPSRAPSVRELKRRIAEIFRPLPLSSAAKLSLPVDVSTQISIHLARRARDPSALAPLHPAGRACPAAWSDALDALANAAARSTERHTAQALLAEARAGSLRPCLFSSYRASDGFLLLKDPETRRLFAWLNLLPATSRHASPRIVSRLIDLRTGEPVSIRSKTGLLLPLSFAEAYQGERFLSRGRPQIARLCQRGDEFYLHVAFRIETPLVKPSAWMGIHRSPSDLVSLCVVDGDGRILAREHLHHARFAEYRIARRRRSNRASLRAHTRRLLAREAIHVAANRIVELARLHRAQVVVEDVRGRAPDLRILNPSDYASLIAALSYKLPLAGLPKPAGVAASNAARLCPRCGHLSEANRRQRFSGGEARQRLSCAHCGFEDDAALNAARIAALRRMWRAKLPPSRARLRENRLPEALSFERFVLDLALARGDGRSDLQAP